MPITFVGSDKGDNGANTVALTMNLPTHQADDFAVIIAYNDNQDTVATWSITGASGYTKHREDQHTGGRDRNVAIFYKKLTSSSETDPVAQISAAAFHSASLYVFRGVDTTTPFDVTETADDGTNDTTPVNPAITPVTDNGALLLWHGATHDDISVAGLPTTPSGLTLGETILGSANDHRGQIGAYKLDYGSAATITPTAWTHTSSPTGVAEWSVFSIALRPQGAGNVSELSSAALTLAASAPSAVTTENKVSQLPAATLTLTAAAPSIVTTENKFSALETATLTLTAAAPSAVTTENKFSALETATLTLTAAAPSAVTTEHRYSALETATLTLTAAAPSVVTTEHRVSALETATLTLTAAAPDAVTTEGEIAALPSATLTLTAAAPSAVTTESHIIELPSATLTITAYGPTVEASGPLPSTDGGSSDKGRTLDAAMSRRMQLRRDDDELLAVVVAIAERMNGFTS